MSNGNKNTSNNISKELDDIFGNENPQPAPSKQSNHKPISTVVGKAFDAIEQKMLEDLQNDLKNSKEQEKLTDEQKKSTIIGSTISALKKTVVGRVKSNKEKQLLEDLKKSQESSKSKSATENVNNSSSVSDKSLNSKSAVKTANTQKPEKPSKKQYQRDESEDDLFTEEGMVEEAEELNSLKHKLDESIESFLFIFDKYTLKIKIIFAKFLLKIGVKSLNTVNKALIKGSKLPTVDAIEEEKAQTKIKEEEPKAITYLKADFEDMLALNIIFTDNYDVPLYKNNSMKISQAEMQIIMANAISSIQECAEFTRNQPPIKEGMFKDQSIEKVMNNVNEETLNLYLGYVKKKPKKYIGKKWKISETFATWLMNGSSLIELS